MLAIQLISLGVLSLQSKQYFEEMFHLASSMYQYMRERPATAGWEPGGDGHMDLELEHGTKRSEPGGNLVGSRQDKGRCQ
jgi:hypothetical protein